MSYSNDIFISYRRETNAWTPWARDTFKRPLESWLQRELGQPANIFIDEQIPIGTNYVDHLATSLARSKVMIPLLSRDYFSSDWCVHELDLMIARSKGNDLIVPILVHDGDVIPDTVNQLMHADFKAYANPVLFGDAPLHKKFWDEIGKIAPRIRKAIEAAPSFDNRWVDQFRKRLMEVYNAGLTGKRLPPKNFVLKASGPPKMPPRLKP